MTIREYIKEWQNATIIIKKSTGEEVYEGKLWKTPKELRSAEVLKDNIYDDEYGKFRMTLIIE